MGSVNFIKNIVDNKIDQKTHDAFVRFGMGEHIQEPFIVKKSKKNIKIQASFEYVNVLVQFVLLQSHEQLTIDGGIPDMDDITDDIKKFGVDDVERKRIFKQKRKMHTFTAAFSPEQAKKFCDAFKDHLLLLNVKSSSRQIKLKKLSFPDIRSDTSKWVTATLPLADLDAVMNEFLFDCKDKGDLKSCTINHTYNISNIIVDEKLIESDPAAARKQAKRKGVLKRVIEYNGDSFEIEYPFEV